MNPDILQSIQQRLTSLETTISKLERIILSMEVDKQLYIPNNKKLTPGISCKVGYDQYGLIEGSQPLDSTDIPQLPISKIDGLESELEDKASLADINSLKGYIDKHFSPSETVSTGCKVSIDKNGRVSSICDLIPDDIPTIGIDKVEGLKGILDQLKNQSNPTVVDEVAITNAGVAAKVHFNQYGRVTKSEQLSMDDMPADLIYKVNNIEYLLTNMATNKAVNELKSIIDTKVSTPSQIDYGTYTKVSTNSNGLVIYGEKLTKEDLPQLTIDDIDQLKSTLLTFTTREDFSVLQESMSVILDSLQRVGTVNELRKSIDGKASVDALDELTKRVDELTTKIEELHK